MKRIIGSFFLIITAFPLFAQKKDLREKLYKLEDKIILGDKDALVGMAKYLDDTSFVQEFLGYHNYPNNARGVAMRVLQENCLFTTQEASFDSTMTTAVFLKLVENNKVNFDDLTGMFLITAINQRKTAYELKQISKYEIAQLDTAAGSSFPEWYYLNQIDGFLLNKDPQALKWIAAAWFKKRSRFNRYYFNDNEFLDLMKKLTRVDLGVPGKDQKLTFLYKDDYYAVARLNYLVYWANHYENYQWNEKEGYFENRYEKPSEKGFEEDLFHLLSSKNDSIAIDAFSRLAELDTGRVSILADAYEKNRIDRNFSLPTFPYRFLKQMTRLTRYCRENGIEYKAKGWVLDSLVKLKGDLPYRERYRIENAMIEKLSLNDITSIEYYGLIYGHDWNLTYSLGRILDKFYSRNSKDIVATQASLLLYLKKATLFYRLGIVGICNKYDRKFENESAMSFSAIERILNSTKDPEIMISAKAIIDSKKMGHTPASAKEAAPEKIKKYGVVGFNEKYKAATRKCKDEFDCKSKAADIIGLIDYKQLGDVMRVLAKDSVFTKEQLLAIIDGNFGIPASSLTDFFSIYDSKDEYGLYEYYFKENGIACLDEKGELNYDKVYDILKYDIVDAFVGGGGGRRENGIYPLIKLLEFKFKTRLGFPSKLCDSGYPNIINRPTERARAWMKFLEDQKLVSVKPDEPVSISD